MSKKRRFQDGCYVLVNDSYSLILLSSNNKSDIFINIYKYIMNFIKIDFK